MMGDGVRTEFSYHWFGQDSEKITQHGNWDKIDKNKYEEKR